MKRGEVWLCSLDPTVGREIRKTRPCLVVSPDDLNGRLSTFIIAPLTSGSQLTRFRIPVSFMGKDGLILPDQLRTLDRQRAVKRLGHLEDHEITAVLTVISHMFAA